MVLNLLIHTFHDSLPVKGGILTPFSVSWLRLLLVVLVARDGELVLLLLSLELDEVAIRRVLPWRRRPRRSSESEELLLRPPLLCPRLALLDVLPLSLLPGSSPGSPAAVALAPEEASLVLLSVVGGLDAGWRSPYRLLPAIPIGWWLA